MGNHAEEIFDYTAITVPVIEEIASRAIDEAERLRSKVLNAGSPRTYGNTLAPLEEVEEVLSRAFGEAGFMGYVHTDPEVRAAGHACSERISKWHTDLAFDPGLHQAVEAFRSTEQAGKLTGERARYLDFVRRDLKKAGHHLPADSQARVKELSARMIELGVAFARNIAEYEDALEVTREDLEGLPDIYIDSLPPAEEEDLGLGAAVGFASRPAPGIVIVSPQAAHGPDVPANFSATSVCLPQWGQANEIVINQVPHRMVRE